MHKLLSRMFGDAYGIRTRNLLGESEVSFSFPPMRRMAAHTSIDLVTPVRQTGMIASSLMSLDGAPDRF